MHICVVIFSFPARSETFVRGHVEGLLRRGHQVTVLCTGAGVGISKAEVDELLTLGLRIVVHRTLPRGRIVTRLGMLVEMLKKPSRGVWLRKRHPWTPAEMFDAATLKDHLEQIGPDVVHVHFGTLAGPLHRASLKGKTAMNLIVTWHGYDANLEPQIRGGKMYQELFCGPYHHTVGAGFMRQRLLELGASSESISQVPMGIDLSCFPFRPRQFNAGEVLKIISVGRLDEMKGHKHLIDAVAHLITSGERVQLRIIGEGALRSQLESQIKGLNISKEGIQLLGAKNSAEVAFEMQSSHVFALPGVVASTGRVETQGVVFAEAQATGLPVIASRIGGVPESLVDRETGILCPPGNYQAIAEAIRFFLRDPAKVHKFGRAGRTFVERKFDRNTMLDQFEYLYSKVTTSKVGSMSHCATTSVTRHLRSSVQTGDP